MNRIKSLFEHKQKNILSVYFTAGYPRMEDAVEIIAELEHRGVDMIEIGIPFSDPMADGPVIQQSNTAALHNGMTLKTLFGQLKGIRDRVSLPLVMMGYLNPVMQYGFEHFCRDCVAVGVDGIIIPDLPLDDYMRYYKSIADRYGLSFVMLITPETSQERIRAIDRYTDGFIYMVSTASLTGVKEDFDEKTLDYFRRVGAMELKNPLMIGFGVSSNSRCCQGSCERRYYRQSFYQVVVTREICPGCGKGTARIRDAFFRPRPLKETRFIDRSPQSCKAQDEAGR